MRHGFIAVAPIAAILPVLVILGGCSRSADDQDWSEIKDSKTLIQISEHLKRFGKCPHVSDLEGALWYSCSEAKQKTACQVYIELLPDGSHADSAHKEITVAEAKEAVATREREKSRLEKQKAERAGQKKVLASRPDAPVQTREPEHVPRPESTQSIKEKCAERIARDGGYNPRNEVHRLCIAEMAK